MEIDSKDNETDSKWLIHLYDNGHTWVAYERSAYLLSYILGDLIDICSIYYRESGNQIIKAEISKKDFTRIVSPDYIIYDDVCHKILDFHISPERFRLWMESEEI